MPPQFSESEQLQFSFHSFIFPPFTPSSFFFLFFSFEDRGKNLSSFERFRRLRKLGIFAPMLTVSKIFESCFILYSQIPHMQG